MTWTDVVAEAIESFDFTAAGAPEADQTKTDWSSALAAHIGKAFL